MTVVLVELSSPASLIIAATLVADTTLQQGGAAGEHTDAAQARTQAEIWHGGKGSAGPGFSWSLTLAAHPRGIVAMRCGGLEQEVLVPKGFGSASRGEANIEKVSPRSVRFELRIVVVVAVVVAVVVGVVGAVVIVVVAVAVVVVVVDEAGANRPVWGG